MIAFTENSFRNSKHVLCWYGLALQAGAINAGGFLACHSFVSHVTGVGTTIGIQIAAGNLLTAMELLIIPFSFMGGVIISALLIDDRQAKGKAPAYAQVMGIIHFLLLLAFISGKLGWLGEFGEPFEFFGDLFLVSILCMSCGLQNASIVSATRGTIRTTHLTGILTDLGIYLIRIRHLKRFSKERYRQLIINRIRLGTFLIFSSGSALSSALFLKFEYSGFILPCITSFIFFSISCIVNIRPDFLTRSKRVVNAST